MQRDYYVFRQAELSSSLSELERAAEELDAAKQLPDKVARKKAVKKAEADMKQAARKAVQIDPHVACLWFKARASGLDNSIRDAWQEALVASAIPSAFHLTSDMSVIAHMPLLSFTLRIPFQLQKPYLSKDERDFCLLDNPLRKEKIFQTPMVASTSWKGALRGAMVQQLTEWWCGLSEESRNERSKRKELVAKRVRLGRLFGTERGVQLNDSPCERYLDKLGGENLPRWYRRYVRRFISSTGFFAGRLYFYPTFFDNIGLEVINPHTRETGVGARGPILMECVPQGTGTLLLLYVPFGPIGQSEKDRGTAVTQDLEVLAKGVEAMLTTYGFGAKTSSGFGKAKDELANRGTLALRVKLPGIVTSTAAPQVPEPSKLDLPRYLESLTRLHADFRQSEGSLKSEAEYEALVKSRGRQYSKKDKQLYEKARKWWEREGRQLAETTTPESTPKPFPAPAPTPPVTELTFTSLSELRDLAQCVAAQLRNGGEG